MQTSRSRREPDGIFDFTSSSPLCPSGSFEDEVVNVRAFQSDRRVNVTIDTVFTCDDGSGAGHGVDIGLTDNETGIGQGDVTGVLVHP